MDGNNTDTTGSPDQMELPKELSFGQKAVGLTFNPSGDENVQAVKVQSAVLIDLLHALRSTEGTSPEQARMYSIAITNIQTAQMWAVKAVTWQFN